MRTLSLLLVLGLSALSSSSAQVLFRADLNGASENPPVATSASGFAKLTLNANNSVSYEVRVIGLAGTAAHIHTGVVGMNGPVLAPLVGGPSVWSGTTAPLPGASVTALQADGLYVNVHTAANPGGELRGQVRPGPRSFAALVNASQTVGMTGSSATGVGSFEVDDARMLTYSVSSPSLVNGTVAHLHLAPVGMNGGISVPLSGGPNTWAGVAGPISAAQYTALQTEGMYVNLHTSAFPGGEIRGQLIPSGTPYHELPALTPVDLSVKGPPTGGGTIAITISNGVPLSQTFILVAFGDGLASFGFQPFLINPGAIALTSVVVPLDASGGRTISPTLPALPSSAAVHFQAFNLDASGPNGKFRVSNGVEVLLTALP